MRYFLISEESSSGSSISSIAVFALSIWAVFSFVFLEIIYIKTAISPKMLPFTMYASKIKKQASAISISTLGNISFPVKHITAT